MNILKSCKTRIVLLIIVFAVLQVTDAYSLEEKSLFIDVGITIGTKGFGIVLAYKYTFAKSIAVELFGSMFPATIPLFGFGAEINYYPEFLHDYGYVNLGISHVFSCVPTEQDGALQAFGTSFWSVNAGVGANTGELEHVHENLPTVLYAELGLARILGIEKKMGKEVTKVDKFLWISDGWYFPNFEAGLRVRQM